MKKLLLATMLLLSMHVCIAQNRFVKKYTSAIAITDGVKGDWQSVGLTVVFNASDEDDVIFYYENGTKRTFHQITPAEKGKTSDGDGYQIIQVIDDEGDRTALQLFDDDKCLRVLIDDGYYVEFHRD